jgi:ribonuclease P protein component
MRLASPEVKRLLSRGHRASLGVGAVTLMTRALPTEKPRSHAGLAIAAPKKVLKRAVDRNIAKRIARESLRVHPLRTVSVDVLLTVNAAPGRVRSRTDRAAIRSAFDGLLNRIETRTRASSQAGRSTAGCASGLASGLDKGAVSTSESSHD